jgi:hypothetical protein
MRLDNTAMTSFHHENKFRGNRLAQAMRMVICFCLAVSVLLTSGCSGCNDSTADKDKTKEKEKEKKKKDFESLTAVALPGYYPLSIEEREKLEKEARELALKTEKQDETLKFRMDPAFRYNKTKLGHWVGIDISAVANNFNADGNLDAKCVSINRPVPIDHTDYWVSTTRPVGLPKGEWKKFETSVFLPRRDQSVSNANIQLDFGRSVGGIPMHSKVDPINLMKSYQYHMVLLSTRSDSLKFLSFMDCIKLPAGSNDYGVTPEFYLVVPTKKDDPIPLPRQALNWTTIAYIVWDDLDPEALDRDQQLAMIDWLHFGGQIIFSGPDCLDRLRSSFLADYLPGQFDESVTFASEDLKSLNDFWAVTSEKNASDKRALKISTKTPLAGIHFKPHKDSTFVNNTGELVLERRVGRGRVVATAFSIREPAIRRWRSFQSFFNNALLRRPSRRFGTSEVGSTSFCYVNDGTSIYDPLVGSSVRFISRDLGEDGTAKECLIDKDNNRSRDEYSGGFNAGGFDDYFLSSSSPKRPASDVSRYGGFNDARQSGVAGWNDQSGIAVAARDTLKTAAGISPPSAQSIAKMLGVYLLVLVPANWLFFRLIGRVEWAWVAAPIIAVVGAFTVIKMASLDIGFVRSVTQVGVLESYGDHARAHHTDYSALYTSLSTRYDVELDNLGSQSLPFAKQRRIAFKQGETVSSVVLNRGASKKLEGFLVRSNSTGLLHTESMLDLNGTFSLHRDESEERWTVANTSPVNGESVGVLRRLDNDQYEGAWIGTLAAGDESAPLEFSRLEREELRSLWELEPDFVSSRKIANSIWAKNELDEKDKITLDQLLQIPELEPFLLEVELWYQRQINLDVDLDVDARIPDITRTKFATIYETVNPAPEVNISLLFDCLIDRLELGPGEVRLIGQTKDSLGSTKFDPVATQVNQQTLIVTHLKPATLSPVNPDANTYADRDNSKGPVINDAEEVELDINGNDIEKSEEEIDSSENVEKPDQNPSEDANDN